MGYELDLWVLLLIGLGGAMVPYFFRWLDKVLDKHMREKTTYELFLAQQRKQFAATLPTPPEEKPDG